MLFYSFVLHCIRKHKKNHHGENQANIAAVMEGKLKEKLESMGIAFLCLAQSATVPTESVCKYTSYCDRINKHYRYLDDQNYGTNR